MGLQMILRQEPNSQRGNKKGKIEIEDNPDFLYYDCPMQDSCEEYKRWVEKIGEKRKPILTSTGPDNIIMGDCRAFRDAHVVGVTCLTAVGFKDERALLYAES